MNVLHVIFLGKQNEIIGIPLNIHYCKRCLFLKKHNLHPVSKAVTKFSHQGDLDIWNFGYRKSEVCCVESVQIRG